MSTKTTFKRIALVAVAALTLGTFSTVSASADYLEGSFGRVSWASAPATATTAVEASAIISLGGSCANATGNHIQQTYYVTIASAPVGTNLAANSVFTVPAGGNDYDTTVPTGYTQVNGSAYTISSQNFASGQDYAARVMGECTDASAAMTVYSKVRFTPDVAGTYVIAAIPADNSASRPTATWTVVASAPVVQSSTAFLNTDSSTASTADASSLVFAAASSVTPKGRLTVKQYSTTDTATVATTAISKDVVVAITKGLVSKTNDYFAGAKSVTTAAATAATNDYYVFANGEVGSASLTVTVGGVLVATKAITFNGAATTLSAALTSGQKTWIAPTQTTTVTVTAKDSAGNASSNTPTITATPASTAIATATVSGSVVTITGVAAGTTVVTIADSAAVAASTTYTVTVAPAASVTLPTLTFDKAEYLPGELMTITVAAAAGDNASFAAFTANPTVSVNIVTVTNPFTSGAVALVGGKATWTAYAPITAGPVTVTATSSTGSAATAAAVTATANVISDGLAQAAVDAAEEAIAAAEAATEAALTAAEAADAATTAAQDASDAVAALSTQVTEWMDAIKAQNAALKAQITSLTNLIIKIQKKVKA